MPRTLEHLRGAEPCWDDSLERQALNSRSCCRLAPVEPNYWINVHTLAASKESRYAWANGSKRPEAGYVQSITKKVAVFLNLLFWHKGTGVRDMKAEQREILIDTLKLRFAQNMHRHAGAHCADVHGRLQGSPDKLTSLYEMERTGGEPDVIGAADDDGA